MNELPYGRIPEPPDKMSATTILIRLVDSIGFRYRWATEGLRQEEMEYQPCDTSMKIRELLAHIHRLMMISEGYIAGKEIEKISPMDLDERRKKTLDTITRIRETLLGLDDPYLANRRYRVPWAREELPIWYLINGPLSDALTHIGQLASWRRINDNPIYGANVFYGEPPKKN